MTPSELLQHARLLALSFLQRQSVGKYAIATLCETPEGLFAVDPSDATVGRQLTRHGEWSPQELSELLAILNPASRVCILGTHVGALLVPIAKRVAQVYGYEANPRTFRLLELNLLLNRLTNCQVWNLALSDQRGTLRFLLSTANSGGSKRVPIFQSAAYTMDRPEEIEVPAVVLDSHIPEHSFDLVMMDIEGSEYFALKGMARVLAASRALHIEFLPHHLRNVAAIGVGEFLGLIEPHFQRLTIPTRGETISRPQFRSTLQHLFDSEQGDNLLFWK